MILLVALARATETGCHAEVTQDLNCNTVDVADERAVDADDPDCAANLPGWWSADWYYDYSSYGCLVPVTAYDADDDEIGRAHV